MKKTILFLVESFATGTVSYFVYVYFLHDESLDRVPAGYFILTLIGSSLLCRKLVDLVFGDKKEK